jgi:8-oxo-dGTP pyrophosphatase MutT (NUDIX family)
VSRFELNLPPPTFFFFGQAGLPERPFPMSPYYQHLRTKIGRDLLLVPSVAAVILDGEGNLLLQEKHGEGWSLPAGAIEPGEAPVEALRREVLEETGLMVEPASIRGVFGGAAFRYAYPNGDVVDIQLCSSSALF